jgi:hypothetical protein
VRLLSCNTTVWPRGWRGAALRVQRVPKRRAWVLVRSRRLRVPYVWALRISVAQQLAPTVDSPRRRRGAS